MNTTQDILQPFKTISLAGMDTVQLMNRKDTKFFFDKSKFKDVLSLLEKNYKVLEINGLRQFTYRNIYFDTDAFYFYQQHHNKRMNRYKIRIRQYVESDINFLEIKFKSNSGRTIKSRIQIPAFSEHLTDEAKKFICDTTPFNPETLHAKLRNDFKRFTLVSNNLKERATIDTDLLLKTDTAEMLFDKLAIAELKQDFLLSGSEFKKVMRLCFIPRMSISKYSVGAAYMYPHLKQNHFKPKKIRINKLENVSTILTDYTGR